MHDRHDALNPGTVLNGFRIERVLGAGGFGITYLAFDLDLKRNVALKEFLPTGLAQRVNGVVRPLGESQRAGYAWGLERFLDEARTLVQLRHPNIVTVLSRFDANGTAYMVMDYVEGESLAARLERSRTLSETELAKIVYPVLDGLKRVHGAGFLHRDIKPGNIYLRADGSPVLLDFGAARQALGHATHTMTAIFSDGYAPFEQYGETGDQGAWSDLYGLGATLYTCVTGERPPKAPARVKAVFEGKRDPLAPAAERGRGRYSARLLAAIDRALAIQERDRPQSVAEMTALLGAAPRGTPPSETRLGDSKYVGTVAPPPRRAGRRGWAIAVVLLLAAGGGYFAYDRIQRAQIEALRKEVEGLVAEARRHIAAGRHEEARRALDRAAVRDPQSPSVPAVRAELDAAIRAQEAAIRAREEAAGRERQRAALLQTCTSERGARYARVQACTQIIASNELSGEPLAAVYAARCHANHQYYYRSERSMPDCEQALRLAPRMALAYVYRARIDTGERSEEDLRTALRLDPKLAAAHDAQCDKLFAAQKFAEALAACNRALQYDSRSYSARINRARVYVKLKRHGEAVADFALAIQIDPTWPMAYAFRGLYHMVDRSDYDSAMKDFDAAIRTDPGNGFTYRLKGLLEWHLKRYDDAYRTFGTGIARDPYHSDVYYSRAGMLEELGRTQEAIADYRMALGRNPRHQSAREGLQRLGATP